MIGVEKSYSRSPAIRLWYVVVWTGLDRAAPRSEHAAARHGPRRSVQSRCRGRQNNAKQRDRFARFVPWRRASILLLNNGTKQRGSSTAYHFVSVCSHML